MSDKTAIEWTDATVNFWWGCSKISPACDFCYAETFAHRLGFDIWGPGVARRRIDSAADTIRRLNRGADRFFAKHGRRRRVFVQSMSDAFDNEVPEEWREILFFELSDCLDLEFQLLTKRVGNVKRMIPDAWHKQWPLHVGLMITVCNQEEADRDIPKLLELRAAHKIPWVGLSVEPMLGPLDLYHGDPDPRLGGHKATQTFLGDWWEPGDNPKGPSRHGVDWVICGGESGTKARPMHPDWVRSLRDQCDVAEVPFLFKQWGEWGVDRGPESTGRDRIADGRAPCAYYKNGAWEFESNGFAVDLDDSKGCGEWVYRLGKKSAGRLLDGRTHDDFPATA